MICCCDADMCCALDLVMVLLLVFRFRSHRADLYTEIEHCTGSALSFTDGISKVGASHRVTP